MQPLRRPAPPRDYRAELSRITTPILFMAGPRDVLAQLGSTSEETSAQASATAATAEQVSTNVAAVAFSSEEMAASSSPSGSSSET